MAVNTDPRLQNQVIYSVYVRAHTPEGTFRAVIPDLDRIKALGTDIIWFLPIHPIGVKGKKGSLGCPYANRDYRTVNPAYGTMDDFKALVDEIHKRGMKCMIDVVYNHTSPDSTLYAAHPEFFYHGPDGKPGNKMGDWADVIDLDYRNRDLWAYQIDSLVMWAQIVDGFRCDVASFVPVEFWRAARQAVAKVNPDCIWLAETAASRAAAASILRWTMTPSLRLTWNMNTTFARRSTSISRGRSCSVTISTWSTSKRPRTPQTITNSASSRTTTSRASRRSCAMRRR